MSAWEAIAAAISEASGQPFSPRPPVSVGGGCISSAFKLSDGAQHWFVKTNARSRLDMFAAEAAALNALADTATIFAPRALVCGQTDDAAYLVTEYVEFGRPAAGGWAEAGALLAALHESTQPAFGWHRPNTIGATPQQNDWNDDWIVFWRERRLGYQLALADRNGYAGKLKSQGEQLLDRFVVLIDHAPRPALLHGDLWSGNISFTADGAPVIYDPATYFGDREAELAMTELFGGFNRDFYDAYRACFPIDAGYAVRKTLYNLYHVLNHLNLFGGGYLSQAQRMIDSLLSEC